MALTPIEGWFTNSLGAPFTNRITFAPHKVSNSITLYGVSFVPAPAVTLRPNTNGYLTNNLMPNTYKMQVEGLTGPDVVVAVRDTNVVQNLISNLVSANPGAYSYSFNPTMTVSAGTNILVETNVIVGPFVNYRINVRSNTGSGGASFDLSTNAQTKELAFSNRLTSVSINGLRVSNSISGITTNLNWTNYGGISYNGSFSAALISASTFSGGTISGGTSISGLAGALAIADGGTGGATAIAARESLGLAIGTNVAPNWREIIDAIADTWTLLHPFDGTNGVGAGVISAPLIGRFNQFNENTGTNLLERRDGAIGLADTNTANGNTFYYGLGSSTTNPLRTMEAVFDSQSATNWWQSIGLHLSSSGSVGVGKLIHMGIYPPDSTVTFEFFTNGYGSGLVTNVSFLFSHTFTTRSNNVIRYVVDGPLVWCAVNGELRWTNFTALADHTWGTNVIVQVNNVGGGGNPSDGRSWVRSVKASPLALTVGADIYYRSTHTNTGVLTGTAGATITNQSDVSATNTINIISANGGTRVVLSNGGSLTLNTNTILTTDGTNALALRNGALGQMQHIYRTFTDTDNWERLEIGVSNSAAMFVRSRAKGTGAQRSLELDSGPNGMVLDLNSTDFVFGHQNTANFWKMVQSDGAWTPYTDVARDLGSPTLRVRNLHAAGISNSIGFSNRAKFTYATNATAFNTVVSNTTGARLWVGSFFTLNAAIADVARVSAWTSVGGNPYEWRGTKSMGAGLVGAVDEQLSFFVDPLGSYYLTNESAGSATSTMKTNIHVVQ